MPPERSSHRYGPPLTSQHICASWRPARVVVVVDEDFTPRHDLLKSALPADGSVIPRRQGSLRQRPRQSLFDTVHDLLELGVMGALPVDPLAVRAPAEVVVVPPCPRQEASGDFLFLHGA